MVDKIYYINLAHRVDRDRNIKNIFSQIPDRFNIQRIDAVNGNNISVSDIRADLITHQGKLDALGQHMTISIPLTRGGIGCALSHRNAYEQIIRDDIGIALIIEDDIRINDKEHFSDKLNELIKNAPKDFDILYIGYHITSAIHIYDTHGSYHKSNCVYGTYGYVVTRKGVMKLLGMFPLTHSIDIEISNNFDKPSNHKQHNRIIAYMVSTSERLVFSDMASVYSQYGTDIQIRPQSIWYQSRSICACTLFCVLLCVLLYYHKSRKKHGSLKIIT